LKTKRALDRLYLDLPPKTVQQILDAADENIGKC
jgi:hypothetical protein